jgi:hypothetical protein
MDALVVHSESASAFALLSSHFQVKPTHSLHTTTDNLSRHAYTLPCLMGGGSYDAVDTILVDVQAPCRVATRQRGGYSRQRLESMVCPVVHNDCSRWTTLRTVIPKGASAEVVETMTNYSSRTTRRRTLTRSKTRRATAKQPCSETNIVEAHS